MMNLRESTFCRALIVALALLFVLGVGIPESSFARVWRQNGHEGDPTDGNDIVAGGGGDFSGDDGPVLSTDKREHLFPVSTRPLYYFGQDIVLMPVFENGKVVWFVVSTSLDGGWK